MALWLDLIPRLHHSDDLDARYHQLDNFTDRSSFDEDGTRLPEGAELALLRSLAAARTERRNASAPASTVAGSATTASGRRRRATTTTRRPSTLTAAAASRSAGGRRKSGGVGMMSLAVTVGVGCGLLVVNAAVLAALYCKRGRLGKLRQQLALLAPPGESAQLVGADRSTTSSTYVRRRIADVDDPSSSPAAAVVVDGTVSSTAVLVPAPPPPPPTSSPRRRTVPFPSRPCYGNPDHIALTSTGTNPDSSRVNAAILCVTSSAPCGDGTNHVTSSSNDTVV